MAQPGKHRNKGKGEDKPLQGKKTFFRLVSYLSGYKGYILMIAVMVILSIGASLAGSYMIRPIINDYIMAGNISGLGKMLLTLFSIFLVGVTATYIQYRLLIKVGTNTAASIRRELFEKMERLPIKYFDSNQHGDLMSRYTNDMDRVSEVLTDNLADLIAALLTLAGVFCLMLYISPILTLVALVIIPLMALSVKIISGKSRKYFGAQQGSLGALNGYAEEMISGQKVIKLFGHERSVKEEFGKLNGDLKHKSQKAQLYAGMMMPIMQNLNTLSYVFITITGALLVIFRGFDVGGLAVFLQYSRQFGRPITDLASLYNNLQAAMAGAERIFTLMDQEPEPVDKADALELTGVRGDICMRNVNFSYEPEKPVLKDISLHAEPGKKIALIGVTGAGKTTIMNMLPRFYDIESGEITIDNISISDIRRRDLRDALAIVLQDTHLFTGTVIENIRLGNPDATDGEVIAAAKLTYAHSFIKRLPHGYDTLLENDGENLSQGQRQLINITRAAISNPAILLLDEATSNIDTRSELLIQKGLDKLMEGRTSIIIAHRLSTIRNADVILVLDEGHIVESGNHRELIEKRGFYFDMYSNQFK